MKTPTVLSYNFSSRRDKTFFKLPKKVYKRDQKLLVLSAKDVGRRLRKKIPSILQSNDFTVIKITREFLQ